METRTGTVGFTAIITAAVAAALLRPASVRVSSEAGPSEVSATDRAPSGQHQGAPRVEALGQTGNDLLLEFLGTQGKAGGRPAADTFDVGILIATLPDPFDSHLDWSFDADLEAIRRAFETSDYVVDRFWLPGPRDSVPRGAGGRPLALREVRPGVILFRGSHQAARRLQILYLVPELPTRGIYKEALWAALEERRALFRQSSLPLRPDSVGPIRIIGPTFSGTALSLRLVLRQWLAQHNRDSVDIVSGSATSVGNLQTFDVPGIGFRATINPDESLGRVLAEVVLPCLGLKPSQVALLQESSTQYGQGLLAPATSPTSKGGGSSRKTFCPAPETRGPQEGQFNVIPFPMSISSLRSEYQRIPGGPAVEPGLPGANEAPRLPLDLLDPTRPKEDLPVSSRLSPLAIDLLLDDVARTITRRQIRLVGLLATDVRDKLFLGDEIRKRVRDVQFFTYESNILYLRPDRNLALRGMLVLSTYPLVLENQWITSGDSAARRFAFGSDAAQGVYNATLVHLDRNGALLDYRRSRDSGATRPPVWLSTVGNKTFLPVTVRADSSADTAYVTSNCPTGKNCPRPPSRWPALRLSFLVLAANMMASFTLLLLAARSLLADRQLRSALRTSGITADFDRRALADQVMTGSLKLHDRLYALLRVVAVSGIFLAAAAPVARLMVLMLRTRPESLLILLFALIIAAAMTGLAALVSGVITLARLLRELSAPGWKYFWEGPPWTDAAEKWSWRLEVAARTLVVGFGIAYFVLSVGFAVEIIGLESSRFWLLFRRAIEIDSMVSPVLPLILGGIGYAVWCTWHIERIALLRTYTTFESACEVELGSQWSPPMTFRSALRDDLRRSGSIARVIRGRLFQVVPSPVALGILVAFLALAWWLMPQFSRSLETMLITPILGRLPAFDLLFRGTVLASMFATAWGACRLVVVWAGLRECLTGFSRMPIVTAFDRLPPRMARLTRLTLPGFAPKVMVSVVADIQWLHLQRIYGAKKAEFEAALVPGDSGLAPRIEKLMQAPATLVPALGWSGRSAQVERFASVHELLRELWRLEPMAQDVDTLIEGHRKEAEKGDGGGAATSTTLRIRQGFVGPVRLWLRGAEEYAASRMVEYVEWVLRHLRVLALFMLLSLLLTTLLVSSYPYQPQSSLRLILLLVLVASMGSLIAILVQMNRNEVLSRIARTQPGQITWNGTFILNLFTFGVVPLLTLVSSEVPALRNALFSWVQPLLSAMVKQ